MEVLGIDIGGSGIKGAPVDTATGVMLSDRHRIPTPRPSTPAEVSAVVGEIVASFDWDGPVGCALPSVVQHGIVRTAANIDKSWIGVDGVRLFSETVGRPVNLLNDADAAGLAEMRFGVGRERDGVVMMLTFGTGIGSALFLDGRLVPNSEFGHMEINGMEAEHYAAGRLQEELGMSFDEWGDRVSELLGYYHGLFWPDLFVLGGGISKEWEEWADRLSVPTEVVPAQLRNQAGIVGSALAAAARVAT